MKKTLDNVKEKEESAISLVGCLDAHADHFFLLCPNLRRNFVKRNLTIAVGVLARGEAALPSVEAIILLLLIACLFVLIESSMIPGLEDDSAMSMIVTIWAERAQKAVTALF